MIFIFSEKNDDLLFLKFKSLKLKILLRTFKEKFIFSKLYFLRNPIFPSFSIALIL